MDVKRGIGIALVFGLFIILGIFGLSEEFPDFGALPPPPAFPGAEAGAAVPAPPVPEPAGGQLPPPPAFPAPAAAVSSPPAAGPILSSLPGDISGPNGVPDGRCVNLYDIWAMGPKVGACQLPAGSPLDTNGDGCFTEPDVRVIMQNVNVRCT